jgi:hypothetical protein
LAVEKADEAEKAGLVLTDGLMGVFILEAVLFIPGFVILLAGKIPLSRRRSVNDSAARIVGAILMTPLPLYLIGCYRIQISPLATENEIQSIMDPLAPYSAGFLHIAAVAAAFFCVLLAVFLAIVTSETKRR